MEVQENKECLDKKDSIPVEVIKKYLNAENREQLFNKQKLKSKNIEDTAEILNVLFYFFYSIVGSWMAIIAWSEIKSYFSWRLMYFFGDVSYYMNYVFSLLFIFFFIKSIVFLIKYIKVNEKLSLFTSCKSACISLFFIILKISNSVVIYGIQH